jgi:TP901 family phage tail tape measure protein
MSDFLNAGSIASEVRIRLDKLQSDINSTMAQFTEFGKKIDKVSTDIGTNAGNKMKAGFDIAKTAALGASAGIVFAFKSVIETFAKTEQSLANVQAVTGASADEFEKLKIAANEAGAQTRFSASQAADALYFLGSAGFNAQQSIDALNGTLLLAGATGSDLAFSAETLTSVISQYGLAASDAARVSNVMAAAIGASQATIQKLASAFRQVGPVAAGLNISLEETTGALELLFNAGFQGEQAGTALRNILGSLASETDPVTKALKALGVSFDQVNPAVNSLGQILDNLGKRGLSTGEIIGAFGREVGPEIVTLIKQGKDALDKYTKAVTGTNAAAEQYAIQNDTLAGSFDQFTSATENLTNSLTAKLTPAMRGVLDFGAWILNLISGFPAPIQALIAGIFAAGAAFVAFAAGANAIGLSLGAALGPIGLAAIAVGGLIGVISGLVSDAQINNLKNLESRFGALAKSLGIAGTGFDKFVKSAGEAEKMMQDVQSALDDLDLEGAGDRANLFADSVAAVAKQTGLTDVQVLKIVQSSNKFSDSLKKLTQNQLDLIAAQEKQIKAAQLYDNSLQNIEKALARVKKEQEDADAAAVQELAKRKELSDAIEYQTKLQNLNLQTDVAAAAEKVKLRNQEIQRIEELGLKNGKITGDQIQQIRSLQALNIEDQKIVDAGKKVAEEAESAKKAAADAETERLKKISELRSDEIQKIIQERDALLIQNQMDFGTGNEESAANMVAIYQDADEKIIAANKKKNDAIEAASAESVKVQLEGLKTYAGMANDIFQALFQGLSKIFDYNEKQQEASIDAALKAQLDAIDANLQAQLQAQGIAEETDAQKLQDQIDAAKAAGDIQTQNQKQAELDRLKLTQAAEDAKTKATQDAEKKKQQASFETAHIQWLLQIGEAVAGIALAEIKALPDIPLMIATGIIGAIQLGVLAATEPKQTFATGGIVLGNSFSGDNVPVQANSGEMFINSSQQKALWDFVSGGSSGGGASTRPLQLIFDGKVFAEVVVDWINSGQVRLNA